MESHHTSLSIVLRDCELCTESTATHRGEAGTVELYLINKVPSEPGPCVCLCAVLCCKGSSKNWTCKWIVHLPQPGPLKCFYNILLCHAHLRRRALQDSSLRFIYFTCMCVACMCVFVRCMQCLCCSERALEMSVPVGTSTQVLCKSCQRL